MKFPEQIGWTLIFWVIVVIMFVMGFLILLGAQTLGKKPTTYSIEFINIVSKPYLIINALSHYKIDDRQALEHAVQSIATNSEVGVDVTDAMRGLIEQYDLRAYFLTINKDDQEFLDITNVVKRCGNDENGDGRPDGTCVRKRYGRFGGCGVGKIEIDDNNDCPITRWCCKVIDESVTRCGEDGNGDGKPDGVCGSSGGCGVGKDEIDDVNNNCRDNACCKEKYDVISCYNGIGICSFNLIEKYTSQIGACTEDMVYVKTDECEDTNDGKTPICCVPKEPEYLEKVGLMSSTQIPLFYKDNLGYLELSFER